MPSAPRQLTVIGDSGVYGWGDREGGGWCERLRRSWMQTTEAPVVYPLGVRGDGLENVAQRWEQEWKARGELRRQTPGGLLLSVGLNDSAKVGRRDGRPLLSADAYRFGVEQLIRAMAPQTQVMVLGLTPVDEHPMPVSGTTTQRSASTKPSWRRPAWRPTSPFCLSTNRCNRSLAGLAGSSRMAFTSMPMATTGFTNA